MKMLSLILTAVLISLTQNHEDKPLVIPAAALRLYDNLTEHTLANGLKVYLLPVSGSPTVTMMTALKVGSCDEDKHATGLAHYLEHLLFKGTKRFRPGDIDRMTQRSGGSNNAYTNYDITNYHFDFASDRWETALEIEAERMRGTAIDEAHEFQQEKGAVIEELARNEDSPWDLEEKALLPMLFGKNSPYGHPIIGEREHVRDASAETIIEFYNKWYHPNNCHLILVGGFEPTQALSRIKAKLESIPRTELPSRKPWIEELPQRPARTEFTSKFPTARMLLGYVTVPQGHADESALDMASMLLASGKTSRLYKRLVLEERMAVEVGCSHIPGRYPGYFQVMVELLPGKDRAKAEKIVLDEINKLADTLVPVAELRRCQRLLISQSIFNRESVHNLAESIAQIVVHQSVEALKKQFHLWAAVTPADVQRVVKQYLPADKPVVVWSVPKDEKLVAAPGEPASPKRMLSRHSNQQASSTPVALSLKQAEQITLPNGLTLIFFHNPRLPIVVTSALIKKVRQFEPEAQAGLAQLTGSLYEEGTTRRTGEQIADAIESVGGTLRLSAQGGTVKTLSDNAALGLELLLDSLLNPTFSEADFQRMKEEQLSEIADAQEQPLSRAAETFNAEIYGKHYKGRPARGTMETVEKLTPDDCRRFHKTVMVPENVTLAIVGDFNQGEMLALVNKFTDGWHGRLEEGLPQPELKIAESATTRLISMPKAAQLQFLMGHLGIPRNHPDYFKLLVMDTVLGTGSGFTDRLSSRLRDREGLAYTVTATICDSAELLPGSFLCYIGTDARNYSRAKALFLEEIERLRKEAPSEYEVNSAKQYLIGRLAFLLTSNERIADQLLMLHRYSLGFDYYDTYKTQVEAVTPLQVKEMAEKYIQPSRFTTVAAGAIDQEGKVITPVEKK